MADEPVFHVPGLTKHFPVTEGLLWTRGVGAVKVVDGITFSVQRGETLAFVGESGCGKTTTAKLILRLEEPTSGQAFVDGKNVHALAGQELREYRTKVQAVFQDPWSSLSPRMRVHDIVAEPLVINASMSGVAITWRRPVTWPTRSQSCIWARSSSGPGRRRSSRSPCTHTRR